MVWVCSTYLAVSFLPGCSGVRISISINTSESYVIRRFLLSLFFRWNYCTQPNVFEWSARRQHGCGAFVESQMELVVVIYIKILVLGIFQGCACAKTLALLIPCGRWLTSVSISEGIKVRRSPGPIFRVQKSGLFFGGGASDPVWSASCVFSSPVLHHLYSHGVVDAG